jgi:hypothetical protein
MRKLLNIALAATVIAGAGLASAAPAAAEDWRDRGGWHEGWRGDRDHDRDRWRDRDDARFWRDGYWRGGGYYYGYGRDCGARWQWSWYYHRYVRVTRCY